MPAARFIVLFVYTQGPDMGYDSHGCTRGGNMRAAKLLCTCSVLVFIASVFMPGCAVGRDDATGAIVLGFEAGRLVETGPQALAAAVGSFVPGAAPIVGVITGLLGIGTAAHYRAKRNGERSGWDERGREVVDTPQGPTSYVAQRNNGVGSSNQDDGNIRPVRVGGHDSGDAVSVSS